MAIKVKDLIKKLQEKDQTQEVEFVVVGTAGDIVCMDIEAQANDLMKLLKLFKSK